MFDASALVSAAMREGSTPERALRHAQDHDVLALSREVYDEIAAVFDRPRFAAKISAARRRAMIEDLRRNAAWFDPEDRVTDCRDVKDNKYLELAAASRATILVTGDADLLVLHPWRSIRILRPADYLAEATARSGEPDRSGFPGRVRG